VPPEPLRRLGALTAPTLPLRPCGLRVALRDALLLPSNDFGLQPADTFAPNRDGARESTLAHPLVDAGSAQTSEALDLTATENFNELGHCANLRKSNRTVRPYARGRRRATAQAVRLKQTYLILTNPAPAGRALREEEFP